MPIKKLAVELNLGVSIPGPRLPGFKLSGEWELREDERRAAWELYIEFATRVTTVEGRKGGGRLREVLSSLD